jgi:predicted metal-dependent HD superfamily phosphohydrolase
LAQELYNPKLPYHNFQHALRAVEVGLKIANRCEREGLGINRVVVYYALLFHDAGYHLDHKNEGYNTKEEYSAFLAGESLQKAGVNDKIIKLTQKAILATTQSAEFCSIEETIVRVADLSEMAGVYEAFLDNNKKLKEEQELLTGKEIHWEEWKEQTNKVIKFYLSQDIRLTSAYENKNGKSVFHLKAKENLEKFLKEKEGDLKKILSPQQVSAYRKKFGELPNTRHLENPALAIDVILGKPDYVHSNDIRSHNYYLLKRLFGDMEIVDWFASPEVGQLGGMQSYKISSVSSKDKISPLYEMCVGIIVTGLSREDNKTILSLLTHSSPKNMLNIESRDFQGDLESRLTEFQQKVKEKTVDAIIIGGKMPLISDIAHRTQTKACIRSIITLGKTFTQKFNFPPRVALGPSGGKRQTVDVLLETQQKKVYIMNTDKRDKRHKLTRDISFNWFEIEGLAKKIK